MSEFDLGIEGIESASVIGSGGFATVYKARQPTFDRTVAVKLLNVRNLDERAVRRFERECQAMGTLSTHPSIATVYDAGFTPQGRPYLVMAFQPGGSLEDKLAASGPYGWHEATRIGVRLAGALETAHRAGVIHRDIKPSNVLMSEFGEPLLSDFGIARIAGGAETQSGVITASVAHAAPEVMDGNRPTEASDVYSLASTIFALVAGKAAFVRETDESIVPLVLRVHTEAVPDLRSSGVPDLVCSVLERAMSKSPQERPKTAEEFGRGLQQAQHAAGAAVTEMLLAGDIAARTITIAAATDATTTGGEQVPSPPTEPTPEEGAPTPPNGYAAVPVTTKEEQPSGRPPWFWAVAGLGTMLTVAVAVVGFSAITGGNGGETTTVAPTSSATTVAPTTTAPPPPTTLPPQPVFVPDVLADPDPVRTLEASGLLVMIIEEFDTGRPRGAVLDQIPPPGTELPPGSAVELVISAGPRQPIAFQSDRDGIFQVFVTSVDGTVTTPLTDGAERSFSPAWAPDGGRIVYVGEIEGDLEIFIMDVDGSNKIRLTESPGRDTQPHWSPADDRIVWASDREEPGMFQLYAIDVNGGNEKQLTTKPVNTRPSFSPDGSRILFASDRDGDSDIWMMEANGSGQIRLINDEGDDFTPAWSPDGSMIVFVSNREGDDEIYVMNADGSDQRRITDSPGRDFRPSWSADGTKIIFTSERDGDFELYLINIDGTDPIRVTNSPGGEFNAVWHPFG